MKTRFLVLQMFLVAFGMVVVCLVDLFSLGAGTCGTMADSLRFNCWEVRLIRSVTGWPTNVAAAAADFSFALLMLAIGFAITRADLEDPIEAPPAPPPSRWRHAWWVVPLAAGICAAALLRYKGASPLMAFGFGAMFSGVIGRNFGRYL